MQFTASKPRNWCQDIKLYMCFPLFALLQYFQLMYCVINNADTLEMLKAACQHGGVKKLELLVRGRSSMKIN
jgi:hypothetical protein